jgi:uncharacterized membrane protein YfcA
VSIVEGRLKQKGCFIMVRGTARWCLLLLIALAGALVHASSTCSTGIKYQCPNCGGIQVKDCFDCDGFLSTEKSIKICFDRKLFQPRNSDPTAFSSYYTFLWNDLVAMVVWFFIAGVAIACGVGGGGIYVPLGVLLLQFSPKQASGLSQCSIFGATLGGLLLNVQGKHPNEHMTDAPGELDEKGRPLQVPLSALAKSTYTGTLYTRPVIHYDMVLFLAPIEISGALLGVIIQTLLPNWLYLSLAVVVLSFTSYKTYCKFWSTRKKEDAERLAAQQEKGADGVPATNELDEFQDDGSEALVDEEEMREEGYFVEKSSASKLVKQSTDIASSDESGSERSFQDTADNAALRKLYMIADMRQFPKEKILQLLLVWIVLFILTMLRGGKGVPSLIGITCEDSWYDVLIALQFTWLLGAALTFGRQLLVLQKERLAVRYPFQKEDPVWNNSALVFYGLCTFAAGVISGLIGIGGGMVRTMLFSLQKSWRIVPGSPFWSFVGIDLGSVDVGHGNPSARFYRIHRHDDCDDQFQCGRRLRH